MLHTPIHNITMDKLAYNESIVGKSFEYWQNLYDKNIIENHVIYLRLNHLKYAIDQNLITREQYYIHRTRITEQYSPTYSEYKPFSLMDFSKVLKSHNSINHQKTNQLLMTNRYPEKSFTEQKDLTNIPINKNLQNEIKIDLNEYCKNEEQKPTKYQIDVSKKPRKHRRKKKNLNKNYYENVNNDNANILKADVTKYLKNQYCEKIDDPTNQTVKKKSVKIFVRQINKKSVVSSKKSTINTSMTDSMNKELVKRVQSSLSKYISKPQLTEKLLNKPPFKFLHDIVTNVIRNTSYLSGVFTDEEIISTNITTKETKIQFLEKLITAIQSTTNKTISARPSKIVAGLEVMKTLELLLAIVSGIETKNKEIKEKNTTNIKPKKPEPTKINNQNKTKVLEKTKSQEKKVKENIDHDSQKSFQKSNSEDSSAVKNEELVNVEIDKTKMSSAEYALKPLVNEVIKNIVDTSNTEEHNENTLQSTVKSKAEKLDSESTEKNDQEENQLRKLSETHNVTKPLRPKSSRPPAPNRRPQSNTYTEIPKHADNFFSKNDDNINDIDDNIVTVEVLNDKPSYDSYAQVDGQGHLVSQILQTQLEFNMKKTDTSKEWDGKSVKDQEMLSKEMDTMRHFIQDITKSANPLSKLINNMQENIDQMNRELNYWTNFTEKTNEKLDSQQRLSEEKIKPLFIILEKLNTDIKDELEMMDYCKANIMKNKSHINYLISERFTLQK